MRCKSDYFSDLKKMRRNMYYDGQLIGRDDDILQPALEIVGMTFDACNDPDYADMCTASSHINGNTISRFNHVHQSVEDLHIKQDMTRKLANKITVCFHRCVGSDAINALNIVSYETDKANEKKTSYYESYLKWLDNFQKKDLVACCAQTDPKGDRKKRPSEQNDPDSYVRVIEKNADGIVVRGCKFHVSGAPTSDEIIVIPGRALEPEDSDYAVAFAVPSDYEGVKHIVNCHSFEDRKHYKRGIDKMGYSDSYVIFDDVFVPWERVFLCGEHLYGGLLALLFSTFRRHSSTGCKPGLADLYLGLAANAAEINGIENEKHVKKIFTEFIKIAELTYAAGFTSSAMGKPEMYMPGLGNIPFGPGSYIPNSIYANIGRNLSGEAVFHEQEMLCNIAGGIPATLPNEAAFLNAETSGFLKKYIRRNSGYSEEDQIKFWLYFAEMTCSRPIGLMNYGYYHGGGSPVMEEIAILKQYDVEYRKNIVRNMANLAAN